MRSILVLLHRWLGLGTALFLFVAGATGAVISWDHELDEWLNPDLYRARSTGAPMAPLELAARVERADPRVRVTFMPLAVEPGHAFTVSVSPRVNPATGRLHEPGYNQVALDPATGEIQARREWGKVSLSRENLLPFLYKLHYSMHIPDGGGVELGIWFMGLVGIVWVFDTLIALSISFPKREQWRRSFAFRFAAGGHKLTFDLHRSGATWVYLLVLMLAVTSVAMNLREQVVRPVVSWFSDLTPSPFATRPPAPVDRPIEPAVEPQQVIQAALAQAATRSITAPAGGLFLSPDFGLWGVGFYEPGFSHGDGGLGNPWLYFDSRTGEPAGADVPGTGSAGDVFIQSMFPLHSGRIIGVPGRVLMSAMGVVIAMLSVTGVLIWWRKGAARRHATTRAPVDQALASHP
jgi:uncharacterized iron-regulated membrane protein